MKTFVRTLLFASVSLAIAPAIAQEANPNGSETLLERLERKVNENSKSVKASAKKVNVPVIKQGAQAVVNDLPVVPREAPEPVAPKLAKVEKEAPLVEPTGDIEVMEDSNLMMPLRELPTGSRFTFDKTLFFPANTIALLYSNGKPQGKIYKGGEPLDNILTMSNIHHSACAIMSDKSYIKFKGADSSTNPTFIDFDDLEYIKDGESNRIIYQLVFQTKSAGDYAVNIKMSCVLPTDKNDEVPTLDMQHVVDAFGHSFSFEPPQYVEL